MPEPALSGLLLLGKIGQKAFADTIIAVVYWDHSGSSANIQNNRCTFFVMIHLEGGKKKRKRQTSSQVFANTVAMVTHAYAVSRLRLN